MGDVPEDKRFIGIDDLANRINANVRQKTGSLAIVYLDLLDFREYVAAIPGEYQEPQRENALGHMISAVESELMKEEIKDDNTIIARDSYRTGYDKIVLCIAYGLDDISRVAEKVSTTVKNIIQNIESGEVPLVEGLEPSQVKDCEPSLIEVKAGIAYANVDTANVRGMLAVTRDMAESAKTHLDGFCIKHYAPIALGPGPQD